MAIRAVVLILVAHIPAAAGGRAPRREPASMKNPKARWLAASLAVVVLGGIGLLGARLRPYWVAKYRGRAANLHQAELFLAPLAGADLWGTNLHEAQLSGANLTGAVLNYAD